MFKEASRLKLRFNTTKGLLSVDQLWDLSQTDLVNCIKGVKKLLKKTDDDELSFLDDLSTVDVLEQLRFDILKDVYLTKKKEAADARDAKQTKEHNNKILELIANKKDTELAGKSIAELEAMLDKPAVVAKA